MVLYGLMNILNAHEKNRKVWIGGEERKGFFSPWSLVRHRGCKKIRSAGAFHAGGGACPYGSTIVEGFLASAGAWGFASFA